MTTGSMSCVQLLVLLSLYGLCSSSPIVGVDIEAFVQKQQELFGSDSKEFNKYPWVYRAPVEEQPKAHHHHYHPNAIPRPSYGSYHSPFSRHPNNFFFPDSLELAQAKQDAAQSSGETIREKKSPQETSVQSMQSFFSCMTGCITTPEYNPVCGSDNETYSNRQKLICANRCGKTVSFVRRGACVSPAPTPKRCGSDPSCN